MRLPALLLLLLMLPGPVLAHAVLVSTQPEDAARLEAPPAEVVLRFNEPVRALSLRLVDRDGHLAPTAFEVRGEALVLIPRPPLTTGPWVVDYRVMSSDGHPVAGTIGFGIGAAAPAEERAPDPDARLLTSLGILARSLHYGGLLIAAGGGLFLVLVGGLGGRLAAGAVPFIRFAALVALLAAVASLGLGAAAAAGLPLAALADDLTVWRAGLSGSLGTSTALAAAGLAVLVAGLAAGDGAGALLATTIGALLAAGSLALTGHAASAPPTLLAVPTVVLHVLAAAFWAGSLWPLAVALRRLPAPEAALVVRRFSWLALVAVALLLLAGAVLSALQGQGSPDPLATSYGVLWLGKMAFVALLLALGAYNKLRLTPALGRDDTSAARTLRYSIAIEALLMVVAVALTAALGAQTPPRALAQSHQPAPEPAAAEAAPGYRVMAGTTLGTAVIEIAPARVGPNRLSVQLPGAPAAARLRLVPPPGGGADILREVTSPSPGHYRADGLDLAVAGLWTIVIETPNLVVRSAVPIAGTSPGGAPVAH